MPIYGHCVNKQPFWGKYIDYYVRVIFFFIFNEEQVKTKCINNKHCLKYYIELPDLQLNKLQKVLT